MVGCRDALIELTRGEIDSNDFDVDDNAFRMLRSDGDNRLLSKSRGCVCAIEGLVKMGGMDGGRSKVSSAFLSFCNLDTKFISHLPNVRQCYYLPSYLLLQFLDLFSILYVFWICSFDERHCFLGKVFPTEPVRHLRPVREVFQKLFLDNSGYIEE